MPIVNALYIPSADIDILLDDIGHRVGYPLSPPAGRDLSAANQSVVFRGRGSAKHYQCIPPFDQSDKAGLAGEIQKTCS